jgi:hypothetical protein
MHFISSSLLPLLALALVLSGCPEDPNPGEGECSLDGDCDAGLVCLSGACEPKAPACQLDLDCAPDEACQDGDCVPEVPCQLDLDCAEGQACQEGDCVSPLALDLQQATSVSTFLLEGDAREPVIQIIAFSDPIPKRADDELQVVLTLDLIGFESLPTDTPIPLGQDIAGSFLYGCNCFTDGTAPPSMSGTVSFRSLTNAKISGDVDLRLSGAPFGVDLGVVLIRGSFEARR